MWKQRYQIKSVKNRHFDVNFEQQDVFVIIIE